MPKPFLPTFSKDCCKKFNDVLAKVLIVVVVIVIIIDFPLFIFSLFKNNHRSTPPVEGSGSDLGNLAYSSWISDFYLRYKTFVSYTASTCSSGLDKLHDPEKTFLFAGCEAPGEYFPDTSTVPNDVKRFPTIATGIAFFYNIPPFQSEVGCVVNQSIHFNMTFDLLTAIYNGSLFYWDDFRFVEINQYCQLPHQKIIPAHYTSENGANLILTHFLSKFSSTWMNETGYGQTVRWPETAFPNITQIDESGDMMSFLSLTNWSLGYTSFPEAQQYFSEIRDPSSNTLSYPLLCQYYLTSSISNHSSSISDRSSSSDDFEESNNDYYYFPSYSDEDLSYSCAQHYQLSQQTVQNAIVNVTFDSETMLPHLPNGGPECKNCWPFTGFSYFYIPELLNDSSCAYQLPELTSWLKYVYFDENAVSIAQSLGYAMDQSALEPIVNPLIDSISCSKTIQSSFKKLVDASGFILLFLFLLVLILLTYSFFRSRKLRSSSSSSALSSTINEDDLESQQVPLLKGKKVNQSLLTTAKIDKEDLHLEEQIGSGSFGEVYKATWRGTVVAVKRMLIPQNKSESQQIVIDDFLHEANLMSSLRHPHIIQFLGATIQPPHLYLITKLAECGSLYDVLKDKSIYLSFEQKKEFALGAVKGMIYLHRFNPPIIHRDLKTANLLVDNNWSVMVTDFGLSRVLDNRKTMTHCGTIDFCAPEVLSRGRYSNKADIYSFGMCLWQIFTRKDIFPGMPLFELMRKVVKERLRPDLSGVPLSIVFIVEKCWEHNPKLRPEFEEVLEMLNLAEDNGVYSVANSSTTTTTTSSSSSSLSAALLSSSSSSSSSSSPFSSLSAVSSTFSNLTVESTGSSSNDNSQKEAAKSTLKSPKIVEEKQQVSTTTTVVHGYSPPSFRTLSDLDQSSYSMKEI